MGCVIEHLLPNPGAENLRNPQLRRPSGSQQRTDRGRCPRRAWYGLVTATSWSRTGFSVGVLTDRLMPQNEANASASLPLYPISPTIPASPCAVILSTGSTGRSPPSPPRLRYTVSMGFGTTLVDFELRPRSNVAVGDRILVSSTSAFIGDKGAMDIWIYSLGLHAERSGDHGAREDTQTQRRQHRPDAAVPHMAMECEERALCGRRGQRG